MLKNEPKLETPVLTKYFNECLILSRVYDQKKHGYQIALEIEEQSSGLFKFNHGTLYPILHKLEKDGLIKGTWKMEGPKRKRKYYTITTRGRKYLKSLVEQWNQVFKEFFQIIGEMEK
ncbi:helix-turn-helix transcriptional regulator [candidate division KSB1 bacterium]|nr:helix-turn-helix transcriptional regulator [candidate division KSB1 bacterium]